MKYTYKLKVPEPFRGLDNALAECESLICNYNSWLADQLKRYHGIKLKYDHYLDPLEEFWLLEYEYDASIDIRPYIKGIVEKIKQSIKLELWPRFERGEFDYIH